MLKTYVYGYNALARRLTVKQSQAPQHPLLSSLLTTLPREGKSLISILLQPDV